MTRSMVALALVVALGPALVAAPVAAEGHG